MSKVTQVAESMQKVLGEVADRAGRETNFIKRQTKLSGSTFTQTLVFGWLSNPDASLEELTQTAASLGVEISAQGLDQRFSEEAAKCLRQVLEAAVTAAISAEGVAIPILKRFNGVYIFDSSTVSLPAELSELWQGSGGDGPAAALKLAVGLELTTGAVNGPILRDGKASDNAEKVKALPTGALRITDLGFFELTEFADLSQSGVNWLSRIQPNTGIYQLDGRYSQIVNFLQHQQANVVDLPILLGARHKISCRLLAVRVPNEVAEKRRRRIHQDAKKKGRQVGQAALAMADWTVFVTNIPAELLTLNEALILMRARWQIELLFKLWKSHGKIDEWRTDKKWRIMSEVYAKLIAMLLQHWIIITGCWHYPNRSLFKASQTVRSRAIALAISFASSAQLRRVITSIMTCLSKGCRMNKRKAKPNTYQLLLDLAELSFS